LALFGNGLLQALLATALAWQAQAMFDGQVLAPAGDYRSVLEHAARLLLLSVLIALLRRRERIDAELLGQLYVRDLRKRLFARLLRSQHASIAAQRRGQLLIRFVSDLNTVRQWVSLGLARLGVAAIVISLVMVALWWLHPLFMLTVGGSLVLTAAALWRQGVTLRQAITEVRRRQGYLAANMTEKIAAVSTIQLFGQAERERRRLARQNRRVIQAAGEKAAAIGSLRAITEIGAGLAFAVGLLVTALLVSEGQASAGTFVAVFTLIGFLSTPLRDVGRVHEYWLANRVALANIQRLMRRIRPLQLADVTYRESEFSGTLVFDELSLEGSLTSFSARVEAGRRVALVGPNGAGKTSLLHAVVRLREADGGDIRIDGVSIRDLPLEQLHGLVAYVGHDVPLLRGTLRENLLYGTRQVSEDALLKAVEQTRALLELRDERFDLLGYSGGAQFVHRFALLHPHRVRRIGLGAAGWYTWPDPRVSYPRGTGSTAAMPGARFDLAGLLRTPILVWVGDRDRERDPALNTSERVDRVQGGHRVARAVNWVRAMRHAGLRLGIRTDIRLRLLPGVTHAFVEADRIGEIGRLVFDDFYDSPTGEDTT